MLDLDIDHTRTSGRAVKAVNAEVVRGLTAADLLLLDTEKGTKPPALVRIRDAHHSIARLVAQGHRTTDIALATGYSLSRISILKSDPAFQELVAYYKVKVELIQDEVMRDGYTKTSALRNDIIETLHERLLDDPERFNNSDLLDAFKVTADRTGLAPATKSTVTTIDAVKLADRLAAGRQRAEKLSAESRSSSTTLSEPGQVFAAQLPAPAPAGDQDE